MLWCYQPHHVRAMAEAVGKKSIAQQFSPDLSKHFIFGDKEKHQRLQKNFLDAAAECGKEDTKY